MRGRFIYSAKAKATDAEGDAHQSVAIVYNITSMACDQPQVLDSYC
jgi:hypothetical protein